MPEQPRSERKTQNRLLATILSDKNICLMAPHHRIAKLLDLKLAMMRELLTGRTRLV